MAGIVPCLAPQDMPAGATAASEDALVKLGGIIATKYVGVPIIQDIVNEPHNYGTWAAWKPVAKRVIDAERVDDFREVYRNHSGGVFIFAVTEGGANFLFIPE